MHKWLDVITALESKSTAEAFLQHLRGPGGVDAYFSSAEKMSPHDRVEIEALERLERENSGRTVRELLRAVEDRKARLDEATSSPEAIELATIHGAKGREWHTVVVFGFDDDQLPHERALAEAQTDADRIEALEDERRLAYVAMTRARRRLVLLSGGSPSRFIKEAGLNPGASAGAQHSPSKAAETAWGVQAPVATQVPPVPEPPTSGYGSLPGPPAHPQTHPSPSIQTTDSDAEKFFSEPSSLSSKARANHPKLKSDPDYFDKHPRAYSSWTPEEDAHLDWLHREGHSVAEIMNYLGRDRGGVKSRLRRRGHV